MAMSQEMQDKLKAMLEVAPYVNIIKEDKVTGTPQETANIILNNMTACDPEILSFETGRIWNRIGILNRSIDVYERFCQGNDELYEESLKLAFEQGKEMSPLKLVKLLGRPVDKNGEDAVKAYDKSIDAFVVSFRDMTRQGKVVMEFTYYASPKQGHHLTVQNLTLFKELMGEGVVEKWEKDKIIEIQLTGQRARKVDIAPSKGVKTRRDLKDIPLTK